jgi:hypothetical protein
MLLLEMYMGQSSSMCCTMSSSSVSALEHEYIHARAPCGCRQHCMDTVSTQSCSNTSHSDIGCHTAGIVLHDTFPWQLQGWHSATPQQRTQGLDGYLLCARHPAAAHLTPSSVRSMLPCVSHLTPNHSHAMPPMCVSPHTQSFTRHATHVCLTSHPAVRQLAAAGAAHSPRAGRA